jgi:superfamily I DNA/RNA helicase
MTVAAQVLAASGSDLVAPTSVRLGDWEPTSHQVDAITPKSLLPVLETELALRDGGRLAIVLPREDTDGIPSPAELAAGLIDLLPGVRVGAGPGALDDAVAVLTVEQVKGLEFDSVVLCEPAAVLARSAGGWGDLYVALTRPTQRLRVVHATPLPRPLRGLAPADTVQP